MSTKISQGKHAMEPQTRGLNIAANITLTTMGPKGRPVFIDDPMLPKYTKDGVTVANRVKLEDKEEDAGAYVIRNVSSQQNDDVGDGTTTVVALTQAIAREIQNRPEDPMILQESVIAAGNKILKLIAKGSTKITKKDIEKVALISSENPHLAKLINEIIQKLGEKVTIKVEDSRTFATEYEIVPGYEAHVGFMSPGFINEKKSAKAIYSDIPVLVSEKKISNISDISPIFNLFAFETKDGKISYGTDGKPIPRQNPITSCVIVCEDIEDSMLGLLVGNNNMGTFNALVIRASSLLLEDIAGAVGAKIISNSTGITFQNFKLEYLGFAKKVESDANKTIFMGDGKSSLKYANELESRAEGEPNMYIAKNIRERVSKLKGSIAVLRIGAPTDTERDPLKDKAIDAVKAVQAALAEGVVEGSGMKLWRIAQAMKPRTPGEEVLKIALKAPFQQIIKNTGNDYAEIVLNMPAGQGYNAKTGKYCDLIKTGIIDPTKVERCALENAISAATTFCTANGIITDYDKKD